MLGVETWREGANRRMLLPAFLYEGEPFSIASMPGAKDDVVVAGSLSKTYR